MAFYFFILRYAAPIALNSRCSQTHISPAVLGFFRSWGSNSAAPHQGCPSASVVEEFSLYPYVRALPSSACQGEGLQQSFPEQLGGPCPLIWTDGGMFLKIPLEEVCSMPPMQLALQSTPEFKLSSRRLWAETNREPHSNDANRGWYSPPRPVGLDPRLWIVAGYGLSSRDV